jgi:hypothetical protein
MRSVLENAVVDRSPGDRLAEAPQTIAGDRMTPNGDLARGTAQAVHHELRSTPVQFTLESTGLF